MPKGCFGTSPSYTYLYIAYLDQSVDSIGFGRLYLSVIALKFLKSLNSLFTKSNDSYYTTSYASFKMIITLLSISKSLGLFLNIIFMSALDSFLILCNSYITFFSYPLTT